MVTDQDYCANCGHNHAGPCADDATSGIAPGASDPDEDRADFTGIGDTVVPADCLAVTWPAGDFDDDEPVHDDYGCDSPECVICDGTEEAWS